MPVYKGSRFSLRTGGRASQTEVVKEVLADLFFVSTWLMLVHTLQGWYYSASLLEGTKMSKTSSPRLSKTPTTTPRRWKGGEHQVDHEEYNQDRKVLFLDEGPLHFFFLWHITGAYFVLLFFIRNTTRAYLLIQMSIFLCLRKVLFFCHLVVSSLLPSCRDGSLFDKR